VRIGALVIIAAISLPFTSASGTEDGRKTLLVYDTIAKPFSLTNEIEPLLIGLTRFDAEAKKIEASRVQVSDIEAADFIVLVGVAG
jgi:hypothetical protein